MVGVTGKLGSGKDTFAKGLGLFFSKNNLDGKVFKIAMADALKQEAWEAVLKPEGLPIDYFYDRQHKEKFRMLLIWWGTEWRREQFGADYWVKKVYETTLGLPDEYVVCVIPDVRFQNEVDFIRSNGGVIVKIHRKGFDGLNHVSETGVDSITADFELNNGFETEEDFVEYVTDIFVPEYLIPNIQDEELLSRIIRVGKNDVE